MRLSLLTCLLLAGTLTFFTSCEKEESLANPSEEFQPAHLVFGNAKELKAAISTPISDVVRPPAHSNSTTQFLSYRDAFKATESDLAQRNEANALPSTIEDIENQFSVTIISDDIEGYSIEPIVKMPRLSNLLNEYRVFQIGDNVIQFDRDETITVDYSEVGDFTNLRTSPGARIEKRNDVVSIQKAARVYEGGCDRNYQTSDRKDHRLKARWYSQEADYGGVGVIEIWIENEHQKKGAFGIWFANEEDEIRANGTIRHYANSSEPVVVASIDRTAYNVANIDFDVHGGGTGSQDPDRWILTGSSVYHDSEDGGQSRGCTISK